MARKKKNEEVTAPVAQSIVHKTATAPRRKRSFDAARYQPTLGFMPSLFQDFNQELKNDAKALRARSRDASINDIYARRYFKALVTNVVGPYGIQMKMVSKQPNGKSDDMANYMLEQRWQQFAKAATVDNKSLREALRIYLETVARDGEVFCVLRKGVSFGKYLLQVQFYESEYCDQNHNEIAANGNEIRQGIEYDGYGRPVAYHLWKFHPESPTTKTLGYNERIRIPAEEVIHGFSRERMSQGRGFPWTSASLLALTHIKEYVKTELIASRIASAKSGFFVKPAGTEETVGDEETPGTFVDTVNAGEFNVLPEGWQLQTFDPQNPQGNFPAFLKAILEGIAASLGIAYHTLSGDLSSANYSSLRQGALEERETYKECQQFLIESFLTPLFEAWLANVIAFQLEGIRLPMSKFDQFNAVQWRPRVWSWIDPAKDMVALQIQLEQNLRSRTDVARSFGLDYVDVLKEIQQEQALARELGVNIEPVTEGTVNQAVLDAIADEKPNTDDPANPTFQ